MSDVQPGGNRRIDRVLSEGYLAELSAMPIEQLRTRRQEAEQEEVDLSYLRRLLQGRIDILRAELANRLGEGGSVVHNLTEILADETRPSGPGRAQHSSLKPSRAEAHRRRVEVLVADVDLSDVHARSDDELRHVLEVYQNEERAISTQRRAVQRVVDRFGAELARRYREGEADVSDLLPEEES